MKFTYLTICPWTDTSDSVNRAFAQAQVLMRAAWYWWTWEKAPILERIACERLTIVLAAAELFGARDWSMGVVAERLGMKQPTLARWLKTFRFEGIEGLKPKRKGKGMV